MGRRALASGLRPEAGSLAGAGQASVCSGCFCSPGQTSPARAERTGPGWVAPGVEESPSPPPDNALCSREARPFRNMVCRKFAPPVHLPQGRGSRVREGGMLGVLGTAWGARVSSAGFFTSSASVSPSAKASGFQALLCVLDMGCGPSSAPCDGPHFADDKTETKEGQEVHEVTRPGGARMQPGSLAPSALTMP